MTALSDPYRWIFLLTLLLAVMMFMNWMNTLLGLLLAGFAAGAADTINTRFIKPVVDRHRPFRDLPMLKPIGVMNQGSRSFPSNHASNTMAIACTLSMVFPILGPLLFLLTLLVGVSRIYCAAHYPSDVVAGWIHGAAWALVLTGVFEMWLPL